MTMGVDKLSLEGRISGCKLIANGGTVAPDRLKMSHLSLTLKDGCRNSSLAAIRAPHPSVTLFR